MTNKRVDGCFPIAPCLNFAQYLLADSEPVAARAGNAQTVVLIAGALYLTTYVANRVVESFAGSLFDPEDQGIHLFHGQRGERRLRIISLAQYRLLELVNLVHKGFGFRFTFDLSQEFNVITLGGS